MLENVGKRTRTVAPDRAPGGAGPSPGKRTLVEQLPHPVAGHAAAMERGDPRAGAAGGDASAASGEADARQVTAALHAPRQVFEDARGARHTIYIRGDGASAELVMASRVMELVTLLTGRLGGNLSQDQLGIVGRALAVARHVNDLIDLSNIVVRGRKYRDRGPELVPTFQQVVRKGQEADRGGIRLPHDMKVSGDVPDGHPLARDREDVNVADHARHIVGVLSSDELPTKRGTQSNAAVRRTERLQSNAIVRKINVELTALYEELAALLSKIDPPLQDPRGPDPDEPISEQARDRLYRRYLLPRAQLKYVSAPGSGITVKPVTVEAINLASKLSTGSKPADNPQIAGWQVVKEFGLVKEGPSWVRMHLVSQKLGGLGIPENLVPGPHVKNQQMERQFESTMKRLAGAKQLRNDNVVFMRAQVTHHPAGQFRPSERAKAFAAAKNLTLSSEDFAKQIDLVAGHCTWTGGAWIPDESSAKSAPPVNLDLPPLYAPIDDANPEHEAAAQIDALKTGPTLVGSDAAGYRQAIDDIVELLALPAVSGHYVARDIVLEEARRLLGTLDSLAVERVRAAEAHNVKAAQAAKFALTPLGRHTGEPVPAQVDVNPLRQQAAIEQAYIRNRRDALGEGSDVFKLDARPELGFGPLPRRAAAPMSAEVRAELDRLRALVAKLERGQAAAPAPSRASASGRMEGLFGPPRATVAPPPPDRGASVARGEAPPPHDRGAKRRRDGQGAAAVFAGFAEGISPEAIGKLGRYNAVRDCAASLVPYPMEERFALLGRFVTSFCTYHAPPDMPTLIAALAAKARLDEPTTADLLGLIRAPSSAVAGAQGGPRPHQPKQRRIASTGDGQDDFACGLLGDPDGIVARACEIADRPATGRRVAIVALLRGYCGSVAARRDGPDKQGMEDWARAAGFDPPQDVVGDALQSSDELGAQGAFGS